MADSTGSRHWLVSALTAVGSGAARVVQLLLAVVSGATGRPSAPTQLPDVPAQRFDEYRP